MRDSYEITNGTKEIFFGGVANLDNGLALLNYLQPSIQTERAKPPAREN